MSEATDPNGVFRLDLTDGLAGLMSDPVRQVIPDHEYIGEIVVTRENELVEILIDADEIAWVKLNDVGVRKLRICLQRLEKELKELRGDE